MGHGSVIRPLETSLKEQRYAHAYLLVGPPLVGKGTLAIDMARAVNCLSPEDGPCGECVQCRRIAAGQHADVLMIGVNDGRSEGPPRTEIGIDDVREVQRQASLMPYEGSHRVFIFDGAEHLSEAASNALLKTLEEPPEQVIIILLTSREEDLLSTIRSRCRRLELRPLARADLVRELVDSHSMVEEEAETLASISRGSLGWAISTLSDPSILDERNRELDRIAETSAGTLEERFSYVSELASLFLKDRSSAREVLYLWLRWWRDVLLLKEGAEEFAHNADRLDTLRSTAALLTTAQVVGFVKAISRTLDALDQNANPRLALEVLMLGLPGEMAAG